MAKHRIEVASDAAAVKERVVRWFMDEGYKIIPGEAPEASWLVVAEDPAKKRVLVAQLRGRNFMLLIQSALGLPEHVRTKIETLDPECRDKMLWTLRFRLLSAGVEFSGVEMPLKAIEVKRFSYAEGLNRRLFMDDVRVVQNAMILAIWTVMEELGETDVMIAQQGYGTPPN